MRGRRRLSSQIRWALTLSGLSMTRSEELTLMTKSVIPQGLDYEGVGRRARGGLPHPPAAATVPEVVGDQARPQPPLVGAKATTGIEARIHRRTIWGSRTPLDLQPRHEENDHEVFPIAEPGRIGLHGSFGSGQLRGPHQED